MRIPVLIESIGPCESSWVPRYGLKRIQVSGLDGKALVVESSCGARFSVQRDGVFQMPEMEGDRLKVKHISRTSVSVSIF